MARVLGKGNKERSVPVPAAAVPALRAWLELQCSAPGPLLCPVRGRTVALRARSSQAIMTALLRRAADAGVPHLSPHDLRGSYITGLLRPNGAAQGSLHRGWDRFLAVGSSSNPHAGIGTLEYRNVLSNYGRFEGMRELSRTFEPWMLDAYNTKMNAGRTEPFMAVDYADLHVLRGRCGIGLHRHRDNSEVFFLLQGRGFMVVGDWCRMDSRERCFEIRTMRGGDLVILRGGNLHGLMNATDEDASLLMFGGYD